ncbi:MAG: acyltransferase family protein [Dehalococcoidia bacterium]
MQQKRTNDPASSGPAYLPGIDGLRAIAVLAVLLFHGGVARFGGGFLGVEVFFVVSGYLITLLLFRESMATGEIQLKAFWGRRARRLLPAAFTLITLTLLYSLVFLPDEVAGLRDDALSAAGYVTNWWLVFGDKPYFEAIGRPSLLQHLWSLAVEEQFYLVWPIVFVLLLRFTGRWGALTGALIGSIGSYALMAALHSPLHDPSRIYYGTDTRAGGLLLGAALALIWDPRDVGRCAYRNVRAGISLAAVAPLVVLGWVFVVLNSSSDWLYPWGFVVTGIGTAAAIVAATHPSAAGMQRILGSAPMRWAGTRSYGIYLWHWPIFMVTRPGLDVDFDGNDLLIGRLILTAVAAELSYRLIERPFRTGAFLRGMQRAFDQAPIRARLVTATGSMAAFALLFSTVHASAPEVPDYLTVGEYHGIVSGVPTTVATPSPTLSPTPTATASPTATPTLTPTETVAPTEAIPTATATPTVPPPTPTPTEPPAPPPPPPPPPSNAPILAVGDSVLIGAAPYLGVVGTVEVDAEVGRQAYTVLSVLRARQAAGTIPGVVIIHVGDNGVVTTSMLDEMVKAASGAKVVFVTVRVGRDWEAGDNEAIRSMPGRWGANVRVADWAAASAGHSEYFISDGIHLKAEGAQVFASVIANAVN